jgi:hypothetical protein
VNRSGNFEAFQLERIKPCFPGVDSPHMGQLRNATYGILTVIPFAFLMSAMARADALSEEWSRPATDSPPPTVQLASTSSDTSGSTFRQPDDPQSPRTRERASVVGSDAPLPLTRAASRARIERMTPMGWLAGFGDVNVDTESPL